jgi:serine/threonine protein kinase
MDKGHLAPGDILEGFEIEKELGRGGMGVVYKAHELSLNRKVALKVLGQNLTYAEEFITRFKREAQIVAAMNHLRGKSWWRRLGKQHDRGCLRGI